MPKVKCEKCAADAVGPCQGFRHQICAACQGCCPAPDPLRSEDERRMAAGLYSCRDRPSWTKERPSPDVMDNLTAGEDRPVRDARQAAVLGWVERELFSDGSVAQRARRLIEEAAELFQSVGGTREEADKVLGHVFSRPAGQPFQEIGGVTTTLYALAERLGISVASAEVAEFSRVHSFPPGHFHARQREKQAAGL